MNSESRRIRLYLRFFICFFISFFILIFPLIGVGQTAVEIFNQGVTAFKKGLYPSALDYFLQAERAGMVNGRLYYNLAAIYYKQENYAAAYSTFARAAADQDLASAAYFNMALSAYKLADLELAKENFQQSYNTAKTRLQRKQALYMASKAGISLSIDQANTWSSVVKATIGKNDNVILIDDEQATNTTEQDNKGDQFFSLLALVSKSISENIKISLSNYILQHDEINSHDYANIIFKTSYQMDLKTWDLKFTAEIEKSYIDGDKFQQNSAARANINYKINNGFSLGTRVWLRDIESKDVGYNHLSGNMQQLEINSNLIDRRYAIKLFISYEWNDRHDFIQNGTLSNSYSPARASVGIINTTQFANKSLIDASLIYRESDYPTFEKDNLLFTREAQRYQFNLSYRYPLGEHWQLLGEYHYLDSDSNDKDFRYKSNIYAMSIMWR